MKNHNENYTTHRISNKINWIVHYVSDCHCEICSRDNAPHFIPNLCNVHTHGMRELYGHPEFQFVLNIGSDKVLPILNTLGLMVQDGKRFKAGDTVSGVLLDRDIRLFEATNNGKKILRVIIPDQHNHFPDDEDCEDIFKLQLLRTEDLMI